MLTRQGWLFLAAGAAFIGSGRLFGRLELYVMGAAAWAVVVVAITIVMRSRLRLAVGRDLTPRRVYAGGLSKVDLTVRNDGDRRTPVLRIFDPVSGTRGADLLVAPLPPDDVARAAYRLPTAHRGIVEVGPLEVVVGDPFGLAEASTIALTHQAGAHRLPSHRRHRAGPPHRWRRPPCRRRPPFRDGPQRRRLLPRCANTSSATTSARSTGPPPLAATSSWSARTSCRGRAA